MLERDPFLLGGRRKLLALHKAVVTHSCMVSISGDYWLWNKIWLHCKHLFSDLGWGEWIWGRKANGNCPHLRTQTLHINSEPGWSPGCTPFIQVHVAAQLTKTGNKGLTQLWEVRMTKLFLETFCSLRAGTPVPDSAQCPSPTCSSTSQVSLSTCYVPGNVHCKSSVFMLKCNLGEKALCHIHHCFSRAQHDSWHVVTSHFSPLPDAFL